MNEHKVASIFPEMSAEEFLALVEDIRQNGLRNPIVRFEGAVLDGRHRLKACAEAGVEPGFVDFAGTAAEAIRFVWSENFGRRHLTSSQKAVCEVERRHLETEYGVAVDVMEADAKERQRAQAARGQEGGRGKKKTPSQIIDEGFICPVCSQSFDAVVWHCPVCAHHWSETETLCGNCHEGTQPKTLGEQIPQGKRADKTATKRAKAAGTNTKYIQEAEKLRAEDPKAFGAVKAGKATIPEVRKRKKQEAKRQLAEEIKAEPIPHVEGPFRVIAIDPPWKYDNRVEDITHRGRNQYPDMDAAAIEALPVARLAHDDCVLWLWTTNAFMHDAFHCLDAWGFTPKTILTWSKITMGLGDYLRNITEHCILAVRGKPILTLTNQTTLITEKRREHSRKPELFFDLVDSLCPGSKLEMFSREQRAGWQAWGAETDAFR